MSQRLDFYHLPKEVSQLTLIDRRVMNLLKDHLWIEGRNTWNSDTLREYGLDKEFSDPQHDIGRFCAVLKHNKKSVELGWVRSEWPSNHGRKIRMYQFVEGVWK